MPNIHALGPFELDPENDLLFRGTEPVALGRRAVAPPLHALVGRPGAVISKDVLIEAAWPGQIVEQSNLTMQIAALRRVPGSSPAASAGSRPCPAAVIYRFVGFGLLDSGVWRRRGAAAGR